MQKKQLIVLLIAGLLSFTSTFTVSWVIKKKNVAAIVTQQPQETSPSVQGDYFDSVSSVTKAMNPTGSGMSERQLQRLIYDIRSKLEDHRDRQKTLDTEAKRIEISRLAMQEDIDRLNELQRKLNLTLAEIHQKEVALKDSLTEIDGLEKSNFQRLASTYEKMDTTQAGRIMTTMATSNQIQDSVKILYYMNERMAGKLLAEIATKKPELASLICMRLKHVKENN